MATFGMTDTGFVPKRLADVLESLMGRIQGITDPETGLQPFVNESADSVIGQMAQIVAEELSVCWEEAYLSSTQFDPQNASGVPLRGLVQLNGIQASYGSYTQITLKLTGTAGTVVPAGSLVSTQDGSQIYSTVSSTTIGQDGTATVNANCTQKGPNDPATNTIITIKTPVFGWRLVTNISTNSVGRNDETDAELHIKQERATSATSYRQVDAIIAGILNVPGVTFARLRVNPETTTNSDGITAKTIAPIVVGGTDEDIARVLRLKAGALDKFQGSTSVTYTGELGDTQVIKFSRPTAVPVYINMDISLTENSQFPLDGQDQIKQAIVDYAAYDQKGLSGFPPGVDVARTRLYTPINSVPGFKVNSLKIGKSANSVAESDIDIKWNEIASFSTQNITITVS